VLANASLLANDTDPDGDRLTAALAAGPSHGTLTLNANGTFLYTPAPGFVGDDAFSYRASDGFVSSRPALGPVHVVNSPPVAADDAYALAKDTFLTAPAGTGTLANDLDADGDSLTATLVAGAQHGTLTFHATGAFTYVPAAGFVGADSFQYSARDGV